MYLKCHERYKDGKNHRYWSIVESYRLANGVSAKRQVLYLGEINDQQKEKWLRIIEAFETGTSVPRQVALFPCDRSAPPTLSAAVQALKLDLSAFQLHRPRQWGACWLTLKLWDLLELDQFFGSRLKPSRKGTQWHKILQLLVCNRFIAPSSEWFVHRQWYQQTALSDLLGLEKDVVPKNALYHCHDRLLEHKKALMIHLRQRWENLFDAQMEVLLYDLTVSV